MADLLAATRSGATMTLSIMSMDEGGELVNEPIVERCSEETIGPSRKSSADAAGMSARPDASK